MAAIIDFQCRVLRRAAGDRIVGLQNGTVRTIRRLAYWVRLRDAELRKELFSLGEAQS